MYLIFFLFWIVLNGRITVEITVFGVVIAAAVYAFICRFMGYSFEKDKLLFRKLPLLIAYFFVLVIEIIKANIVMIQYIFSPQIEAEPALVRFHAELRTPSAQVLLANSITLTPGTITVEMKDGEYLVHCYDKSMGEGLESSVFVSMLKKMEG
jgi:multicomponent Na+:H+ antiporter subunit E